MTSRPRERRLLSANLTEIQDLVLVSAPVELVFENSMAYCPFGVDQGRVPPRGGLAHSADLQGDVEAEWER